MKPALQLEAQIVATAHEMQEVRKAVLVIMTTECNCCFVKRPPDAFSLNYHVKVQELLIIFAISFPNIFQTQSVMIINLKKEI